MSTYLAVPALPAEQQDRNANPSTTHSRWVVVRASDEEVVVGHTMYLDRAEAESIAARMSAGVPVEH
jgi:hypothetical protein